MVTASLVAWVQALDPVKFWILTIIATVVTASGFAAAFRHLSRARILEDVPTSRVRSASQGYVELQGTSRLLDGPPIFAPLTQTRCVWWEYRVEKRTNNRKQHWRTIRSATSDALFALEDGSGRCIIDPDGAEVYPMLTRRWYGDSARPGKPGARRFRRGRYRYTESRMHVGDPLYAIGQFRTRYPTEQWNTDHEVRELLRQWKRDEATLLERFDRDGDGRIDLEEWEQARAAARAEVRREHRKVQAQPGLSVLSQPPDGRPFLLGALPQPQLARKLRRQAVGGLASFAIGGVALALLITGRLGV